MSVTFEVLGIPTPQGSKTRMPNGAMIEGRSSGQRAKHADWRHAVAFVARDVAGDDGPMTGALELTVEFRFPMPKSRPKWIRELGTVPKTSMPDTDKLIRSVGDALTASGLIKDDALFAKITATKVETVGWTGAIVTVGELVV